MYHLIIGIGRVSLLTRHAQTLKDKRHIIKSLVQRLKNMGFSATETGEADNVKQGTIGFAFAGSNATIVDKALDDAFRLFVGDFEVLGTNRDVLDYSSDQVGSLSDIEDWKYGG